MATASFVLVPEATGERMLRVTVDGWMSSGAWAHGVEVGYYQIDEDGTGSFSDELPPITSPLPAVSLGPTPPEYDPEAYVAPDGITTPTANPPTEALSDDPPLPVGTMAATTFRVTGCWNIQNELNDGEWWNERWTQVRVMDKDTTSGDDELWRGLTGSDGCFTSAYITRAESDGSWQDVYVVFEPTNSYVEVRDSAGGLYGVYTATVWEIAVDLYNVGELAPSGYKFAWRAQLRVQNGWDLADNYGGRTVSWRVNVRMPSTQCTQSCYISSSDTIHLRDTADAEPDTPPHEYGHFLMDKFYIIANPGGGDHYFCDVTQNRGLAWSEGFANWFGTKTSYQMFLNAVPHGDGDTDFNGNSMETTSPCFQTPVDDQSEANVGRALWDLDDAAVDSANGYTDSSSIAYSTSDILDVLDDCDDTDFRDYYDSALCSWSQHYGGTPASHFRTVAKVNNINYGNP